MSPDEMRIAIAESCGWSLDYRGLGWLSPSGEFAELPDYCNDLNAMHEAEKVLNKEQINTYLGHLYANGKAATSNPWEIFARRVATHATAAQRGEAFLRTIGKWEGGAA